MSFPCLRFACTARLRCGSNEFPARERAALGKITSVLEVETLRITANLDAVAPGTLLELGTSGECLQSNADRIAGAVQAALA